MQSLETISDAAPLVETSVSSSTGIDVGIAEMRVMDTRRKSSMERNLDNAIVFAAVLDCSVKWGLL